MNDYGKLDTVKPKCRLSTYKYFRHYKHFVRESIKWVAAKDVNTQMQYGEHDFAQVGISKETGRWGIIEIQMCLSKVMFE